MSISNHIKDKYFRFNNNQIPSSASIKNIESKKMQLFGQSKFDFNKEIERKESFGEEGK